MLLLTLCAALLIAVLSGMGVGGGGLFVIYLALFTDTPQLAAQGVNLLFFLFSSGSSVIVHLSRRQIFFGAVSLMAGMGIVGSIVGSLVSGHIDQSLLRKIFGGMLVICGILSLKGLTSSVKTKVGK